MRCPKCGNEVSQDEAFCGQCGTPTLPQAHPTEMVYTPPQRSGLLNSYNPNNPNNTINNNMPSIPVSPPNAYNSGMLPPPQTYNSNPGGAITPNQAARPFNQQQQTGFYQDATEESMARTFKPAIHSRAFQERLCGVDILERVNLLPRCSHTRQEIIPSTVSHRLHSFLVARVVRAARVTATGFSRV